MLKKRFLITATDTENSASQWTPDILQSLFAKLRALRTPDTFIETSPGTGAYSFEPSEGLFQYAVNYLRNEYGIIRQVAALTRNSLEEALVLSHSDLESVLAEYELLCDTEHTALQNAADALRDEKAHVLALSAVIFTT